MAAAVGEVTQLVAQTRQRERRICELIVRRAVERAAGEPRARPAPERAARSRRRRADKSVAAPAKIDVAVRPYVSRVRERSEVADQAQFLQRGFELRAGDAPLDPFESAECAFDRRPLAVASEVR